MDDQLIQKIALNKIKAFKKTYDFYFHALAYSLCYIFFFLSIASLLINFPLLHKMDPLLTLLFGFFFFFLGNFYYTQNDNIKKQYNVYRTAKLKQILFLHFDSNLENILRVEFEKKDNTNFDISKVLSIANDFFEVVISIELKYREIDLITDLVPMVQWIINALLIMKLYPEETSKKVIDHLIALIEQRVKSRADIAENENEDNLKN